MHEETGCEPEVHFGTSNTEQKRLIEHQGSPDKGNS